MVVTIVRHGPAVDVGENGVKRDGDRMLSDEGREKTAAVAAGLRALECRPDHIFTSPLIRARETAELLASGLMDNGAVTMAEELLPGVPTSDIIAWLARQKASELMLVGHLPSVAELASALIAGTDDVDVAFKKATACRISFDTRVRVGAGTLEWLLPPRVLRMVGSKPSLDLGVGPNPTPNIEQSTSNIA